MIEFFKELARLTVCGVLGGMIALSIIAVLKRAFSK